MKSVTNWSITKWSDDVSRLEDSWGNLEERIYYQRDSDLLKGFIALKAIRKQTVIQTTLS